MTARAFDTDHARGWVPAQSLLRTRSGVRHDESIRARLQRIVTRPRPFVLALVVGLLLVGGLARPAAADLFTPVTEAQSSPLPSDDLTLRSRVVTMDLGQVGRAQAAVASSGLAAAPHGAAAATPQPTLTFNLFADVVVTALVEHTEPTYSGGYAVSGHLVDEPLSTLTPVVNGETVAGTVRRGGETYHIRSVGAGRYAISEVAESPLTCGVGTVHPDAAHPH